MSARKTGIVASQAPGPSVLYTRPITIHLCCVDQWEQVDSTHLKWGPYGNREFQWFQVVKSCPDWDPGSHPSTQNAVNLSPLWLACLFGIGSKVLTGINDQNWRKMAAERRKLKYKIPLKIFQLHKISKNNSLRVLCPFVSRNWSSQTKPSKNIPGSTGCYQEAESHVFSRSAV